MSILYSSYHRLAKRKSQKKTPTAFVIIVQLALSLSFYYYILSVNPLLIVVINTQFMVSLLKGRQSLHRHLVDCYYCGALMHIIRTCPNISITVFTRQNDSRNLPGIYLGKK